jgi:hypothetical protein
MGKQGLPRFLPSRVQINIEKNVRLFVVLVRTFLLFKSQDEISFKGEGCDTPSVTIATTMFYNTFVVYSTV